MMYCATGFTPLGKNQQFTVCRIVGIYPVPSMFFMWCDDKKYPCLGTIHILRNHIFRIFGPPSPLRNHVFSTENNQKLAFSDPPPPLQVIIT